MMSYLWLKVFHIFFVIGWMAGIFYLPRIFVHFQYGKKEGVTVDRLKYMGQKLFSFMTIIGFLAIATGIWLLTIYGFNGVWLHVKLTFVFFLIVYHVICGILLRKMKRDMLPFSHIFYRFFNEVPLFFLLIIIIVVVFKPSDGQSLMAIFGR